MKLNKIFFLVLISSSTLIAQDISITEIKVLKGFEPSIPQANRLNSKAIFSDTIKKDRSQNYSIISETIESEYTVRVLKPAKIKNDRIAELYATTISLGLGNRFSTSSNVVHNSLRSKRFSYGIMLNHFANKYRTNSFLAKNSSNNITPNKPNSTKIFDRLFEPLS